MILSKISVLISIRGDTEKVSLSNKFAQEITISSYGKLVEKFSQYSESSIKSCTTEITSVSLRYKLYSISEEQKTLNKLISIMKQIKSFDLIKYLAENNRNINIENIISLSTNDF